MKGPTPLRFGDFIKGPTSLRFGDFVKGPTPLRFGDFVKGPTPLCFGDFMKGPTSLRFGDSAALQPHVAEILVNGRQEGVLEVFHTQPTTQEAQSPFLREEQALLISMLGRN